MSFCVVDNSNIARNGVGYLISIVLFTSAQTVKEL